ncbi:MAG: 3'-5' exonuclease, partial [Candidatus Bathyarchaeia archaeon]
MEQKRLDEFSIPLPKPQENKVESLPFKEVLEKERRQKSFEAPENLPPSYFVSATYDGKVGKAVIKLYEPISGRIYFWYDNTGHKPYCYTNLSPLELEKIDRLVKHPGFDHLEIEEKYNPLLDRMVTVTKVVAKDPLAIGGRPKGCIRDIIPEDFQKVSDTPVSTESIKVWEAKIKYYQSYIYDRKLLPGMVYEVKNGNLVQTSLNEAEKMVKQIVGAFKDATTEELEYIEQWARLLEYPAPKFRYAAIDIEVQSPIPTRMPDPRVAEYPIVCVSVYGSDGQKRVLLLKRAGVQEGTEHLPVDVKVEFFGSEENLIKSVFDVLLDYPFIVTFNGDDFDLRYLAHRAEKFGFKREEIPIEPGKRICLLKYGVHIDLYKFFFNRSIQIYAFSNRYRDVTLGDVGKALIGLDKIPLEKSIGELTY